MGPQEVFLLSCILAFTLAAPSVVHMDRSSLLFESEYQETSSNNANDNFIAAEIHGLIHGTSTSHQLEFSPDFSRLKHLIELLVKKYREIRKEVKNEGIVIECLACKLAVDLLQTMIKKNSSIVDIVEEATELCTDLDIERQEVCHGLCEEFAPQFITVISKLVLSPSELCGILIGPGCGTPYYPWMNWNVTLPDVPQPKPVYPKPPKAGSPTYRFLHLTDVHFDSEYQPGANANCKDPLCCRASSGKPANATSDAAWKFGDYRRCDSPLSTLENLFSHLAEKQDTFDYIIWTGDIPAHNVWEQPRQAQIKVIEQVADLISHYFPNKTVYPSLGNHEGSPVNSFPPPFIKGKNSIDWLYKSLAANWKKWLPQQALKTVLKGGYYTVSPYPGFRIISLNMNYCNNMNWWLLINMTDPAGELQWLMDTLQAAENAGEKVHIIGHIPPGISDCVKSWSWNYYKIVSRYQNTIAGQFYGHTHTDSFTVFYDEETLKIPVSIAYVAPSVTPYNDLNMGYRIYTVDGKYKNSSYYVLDHETFYLDLEKSHRLGNITWEFEYSAKATYAMSSVYPKDWDQLITKMKTNNTLLTMYNKFYRKSRDSGDCDDTCRKARLCEARSGRSNDPSFCKDLDIQDEEELGRVMGTVPKHC